MFASQAESPATVTQSAFPEVLMARAPGFLMSWTSGSEAVTVVVAVVVDGVAVVVDGDAIVVDGVGAVVATVPPSPPHADIVNRRTPNTTAAWPRPTVEASHT